MVESIEYWRGKSSVSSARRYNAQDMINSGLASDTSVEGTFMVDGRGESSKIVNFPIKFIERPNFVTGGELHLDSHGVAGSYPMMSCVVNQWVTDPDISVATDFSKVYFVGAELLVVTTGPVGQRMWIHWRASGKAITNPDSSTTGTTTGSII